jgi:CRISPR-associated exonuclease Cas4
MAVRSLEWGLIGKCDLVELWYEKADKVQRVLPVEFKRGREKESDVDRVQLCAQALCLEEMLSLSAVARGEAEGTLGVKIEKGQIYYLQEHRRKDVIIDAALREKTAALIKRIRDLREAGKTPAAEYAKRKCDNCSLVEACMPPKNGGKDVARYVQAELRIVRELCGAE